MSVVTNPTGDPPSEYDNAALWNRLYESGAYLWYPYEVAVRVVRRHLSAEGFAGVVLDHGCGSGNHLEFFVRLGLSPVGTEVAANAVGLVRNRFRGAMLSCPPIHLIDPGRPLAPQLPRFDHAFAWGSLHYNHRARTVEDIGTLADRLPKGGAFILCVPSVNDVVCQQSEQLPDGSRRITSNVSGQHGAIVTVPENDTELIRWCRGITIHDCGTFGSTLGGVRSEFHFVYGVKG